MRAAQVDGAGAKKSWKFLQKYWHKGAFFQDEGDAGRDAVGGDAIFRRDYSSPTGDDKMDKTVLPKVGALRPNARHSHMHCQSVHFCRSIFMPMRRGHSAQSMFARG